MRQGVLLSRSLFRFGGRIGAKPDNDEGARKGCLDLCLPQRMREYNNLLQAVNCTDLGM